jgi:hypothetical protein
MQNAAEVTLQQTDGDKDALSDGATVTIDVDSCRNATAAAGRSLLKGLSPRVSFDVKISYDLVDDVERAFANVSSQAYKDMLASNVSSTMKIEVIVESSDDLDSAKAALETKTPVIIVTSGDLADSMPNSVLNQPDKQPGEDLSGFAGESRALLRLILQILLLQEQIFFPFAIISTLQS